MRAGICSIQQVLTAYALSTVKQAVGLARRRGHAQITPLHVASVMLATSGGLLRKACLQSHSHPLQCKALELCFNVALNRLPASTSSALLAPHSSFPSLSNALVAAFKRAQARQRRGSIENQQQPILALKIEVEQLIISILDDPSVSRVMREAGFSSTQVKNQVEQTVSLEIRSQATNPVTSQSKESTKLEILGTTEKLAPFCQYGIKLGKPVEQARDKDVTSVLNTLVSRKRNYVIIGECLASAESVVGGVMDKLQRGHAPGDWRPFLISVPLSSFTSLSKEEVEQKLMEVKCIVKSYKSQGVVLYLGDLTCASDFCSSYSEQRSYCSSVEYITLEIQRLVRRNSDAARIWLMGTATFRTYMKCKAGNPSLETIWDLYPLTIPVGSLSLALNLDSDVQSISESKAILHKSSWPWLESGAGNYLICIPDFSVNSKGESITVACITGSTSSSLPSWLQQHKEDITRHTAEYKDSIIASDICKKWNSFCGSPQKEQPHYPQRKFKFDSSPPSPNSFSSKEHRANISRMDLTWPVIFEPSQFPKEHLLWRSNSKNECCDIKPELLSNPTSSPNSASSSEATGVMEGLESFKELNAKNLKILCRGLEEKIPWQKSIIPDIATSILQCRSGMSNQNKELKCRQDREESWLFFLGADVAGKEKIAKELARIIFGSQSNFVSLGPSGFSSTRADSAEDSTKKRARDEHSYVERFGLALNENPHRVFFLDDLEQLDYCSIKGIKRGIESGTIRLPGGENALLKDAIIILSCETFSSASIANSPPRRGYENEDKDDQDHLEEKNEGLSLDLNIAFEDDDGDEHPASENGLLQLVDRKIVFSVQESP